MDNELKKAYDDYLGFYQQEKRYFEKLWIDREIKLFRTRTKLLIVSVGFAVLMIAEIISFITK